MIDRRVKLCDVELKAILGSHLVQESTLNRSERPVDALSLYAGICVSCEHADENGLQYVHRCMVDDAVRVIGKPKN